MTCRIVAQLKIRFALFYSEHKQATTHLLVITVNPPPKPADRDLSFNKGYEVIMNIVFDETFYIQEIFVATATLLSPPFNSW